MKQMPGEPIEVAVDGGGTRSRSSSNGSSHSGGSSVFQFGADRDNGQFLSQYFFIQNGEEGFLFGKNDEEFFREAGESDGAIANALNLEAAQYSNPEDLMINSLKVLHKLKIPESQYSQLNKKIKSLLGGYLREIERVCDLGVTIKEVSAEGSEERETLLKALTAEAVFESSQLFADLEKCIKNDIREARSRRVLTEEEEIEEAKIPGIAPKKMWSDEAKASKVTDVIKKAWNVNHSQKIHAKITLNELLAKVKSNEGGELGNAAEFISDGRDGFLSGAAIYSKLKNSRYPEKDWGSVLTGKDLSPLENIDGYIAEISRLVHIIAAGETMNEPRFFASSISEDLSTKFSVITSKRTKTANDEVIDLGDGKTKTKNHDYDHVTAYCALIESFIRSIPSEYRARELSEFVVERLNLVLSEPMSFDLSSRSGIDKKRRDLLAKLGLEEGNEKREVISNLIKRCDLREVNGEICEISERFLREINREEFSAFPQGGGGHNEGEALKIIRDLNDLSEPLSLDNCEVPMQQFSQAIFQIFDLKYGSLSELVGKEYVGDAQDYKMMEVVRKSIERHFRVIGVVASSAIYNLSGGEEDVQNTLDQLTESFLVKFLAEPELDKKRGDKKASGSFCDLLSRKSFSEDGVDDNMLQENKEILKKACLEILQKRVVDLKKLSCAATNVVSTPPKAESMAVAVGTPPTATAFRSPDGVDGHRLSPDYRKDEEVRDASTTDLKSGGTVKRLASEFVVKGRK